MFDKVNLVTQPNGYDTWKCSGCGKKFERPLGPPSICPNCKLPGSSKDWDDIPIFGVWTNDMSKWRYCDLCGWPMIVCPKEGHPNSKFWRLKRYDDEELIVCSRGCKENGPKTKRTKFPWRKDA